MGPAVFTLLAVVTLLASSPHDQEPSGKSGRIKACAFLTREVVVKVAPRVHKIVLDMPAEEEPVGANGSSCQYGTIGLQIDPFARSEDLRRSPGKDWQPVSGVGDAAWFRNNEERFAELMVWTGAHHFTIQMDVPTGSTAEQTKPSTIELARTIIPKLK
jgi:hypothetical protein